MAIRSDIQKLSPGTLVELYVIDLSIFGQGLFRCHSGTKALGAGPIVFQGNSYVPFPIEASGFECVGQGQSPRPKVTVANVDQFIGALNRAYDDIVGAKFTRKRTFAKYLDGEATADPLAEFPPDIYYIERKIGETSVSVEYELVGIWDLEGVKLPARQVVADVCWWHYRDGDCPYTGGPVAQEDDTPTDDPDLDKCGRRVSSCQLRFGSDAPLPFGGFPGAGRVY
jgi:lambda family phage minor tail protein L